MRKLVTTAVALTAIVSSFAFSGSAPVSAQRMMDHQRCPRHTHWVPPHRNRYGHWVHGRCVPN